MRRWVLAVGGLGVGAAPMVVADSIWDRRDPRYAFLFQDNRARAIGDILTVTVTETTVAAEQDASLKQRDEWGVKPDAGFEVKLTREERTEWLEYIRDLPNIPIPGKPAPKVDPAKDKQLAKALEHLKAQIKK